MRNHIEIDADTTRVMMEIFNRDDLEKLIEWLPRLRPLYPYPDPPTDPVPGEHIPGSIPRSTQGENCEQ